MAVKLNKRAFDYAKKCVKKQKVVFDKRDDWSEHQPSAPEENEFIRVYGFADYGNGI
jgi:hypothetical protein